MAEVTYKKITELDSASLPLDGANEYALVSQSGVSKKALWSGIFGGGWWTKLKAAFDDFVAPEALHATDADTLGGEAASYYTDASNITSGALPLERIPAELTGKNAATATLAATATNALACSGNAATATLAARATKLATARTIGGVSFDGTANINLPGVNTAGNQNTSGNAATATTAASCSGNAATATTAASCSGNAATATIANNNSVLNSIGSYAFLKYAASGVFNPGDTYTNDSNNNLRYACVLFNGANESKNDTIFPTGTWRCMGYNTGNQSVTLWVKISN